MKVLHTSDWHLGKKLFGKSRLPEQELFLDWLEDLLTDRQITTLLVAGDVFDTPNPPDEALKSYFGFLKKCSKKNIEVFVIGGNHDSGNFLNAPASFLMEENIHVSGKMASEPNKHFFRRDDFELFMLPFFRPHELFEWGKNNDLEAKAEEIEGRENFYIECLHRYIQTAITHRNSERPLLAMAHHLVGSFMESGSELTLSMSGLSTLPTRIFDDFDYVAMGHIHKPQTIKKCDPVITYCGSPIPLRFSETTSKYVNIVHSDDKGVGFEKIEIPTFRRLIRLSLDEPRWKEQLDDYYKDLPSEVRLGDFVEAVINWDAPVFGLVDELKAELEKRNATLLSFHSNVTGQAPARTDNPNRTIPDRIEDLFDQYYREKFPDATEVPEDIKKTFHEVLSWQSHPLPNEDYMGDHP